MNRRRAFIPQRTPMFVGCEGQSEAAYMALVAGLARQAGLPVHIEVQELTPGAGDPLARVIMAIDRIERARRRRGAFARSFILLDDDQRDLDRGRAADAQRRAAEAGITLVWQSPCHEALLLRHLPGCATRRPQDSAGAAQALLREWPAYRKPMSRVALAARLDLDALRRAADAEPELHAMFATFGFWR